MKKLIAYGRVGLLVGFLALTATGWANDQPAARQAVELLMAERPHISFHRSGPRITRAYGEPLSFGTTPVESTERFRRRHAKLFGVDPDDLGSASAGAQAATVQPLMYDATTGKYKFTLVRYVQRMSGIPVFRSDLRLFVRNEADHPLVLAASSLRDVGKATVDVTVVNGDFDPAQVRGTGMERFSKPEQVIWAGLDDSVVAPRLAYIFFGKNGRPNGDNETWMFVVDAITAGKREMLS